MAAQVSGRSLLTEDRERRAAVIGARPRWTRPQQALFDSPYRLTVWWGANGIGKSKALAELARRALASELSWQKPGPKVVILAGNTWSQLGSTLRYLWEMVDRGWFKAGIRYEGGGIKGQRLAVYDIVGGPGKGGELRLGTFDAENLAGPRADVVISDEPLPERVYNELWPRLLGRNGRMYMGFTPTLGTSTKLDYLWALVDAPGQQVAGQIQTELTLDAVTPQGGLWPRPWMTQQEIDEFLAGISAVEADMRAGRSRQPRRHTAYFSAWGPHLMGSCQVGIDIPPGTRLGIGIDHGSRPGAQRAMLVACGGTDLLARAWVIDEYQGDGRTESEEDAAGIVSMIVRNGLTLGDIDLWIGDRAHGGDRRGGMKSNERLKRAIAAHLGHDVRGRGWSAKLPKALRHMETPVKYDRSVWEGCEILHRLMVGNTPRLRVAMHCAALNTDLSSWQGAKLDPHKDGIDALRYIVVPMVEGAQR